MMTKNDPLSIQSLVLVAVPFELGPLGHHVNVSIRSTFVIKIEHVIVMCKFEKLFFDTLWKPDEISDYVTPADHTIL